MSKVKASIHPLYAAARREGYTAYIAIAEVYMKSFREFADENARDNSATNGAQTSFVGKRRKRRRKRAAREEKFGLRRGGKRSAFCGGAIFAARNPIKRSD